MKIIVNVLLLSLICMCWGQSGSIVISEAITSTDSMAVLEVKSKNKGVLLPKMTYNQMQKIKNPADGLSVYVEDALNEGVWYWDAYLTDWIKVTALQEGVTNGKVVEPVGTIVGYTGSISDLFTVNGTGIVGTKMEGWSICNGYNNTTPDLSGRFIVGMGQEISTTTEVEPTYIYQETNTTVVEDSFALTIDNLPAHKHLPKDTEDPITVDHKHKLNSGDHSHVVKAYGRRRTRRGTDRVAQANAYSRRPGPFEVVDAPLDLKVLPPKGGTVTYEFPNDYLETTGGVVEDNHRTKKFDARPPYYVVIFIMKTAN